MKKILSILLTALLCVSIINIHPEKIPQPPIGDGSGVWIELEQGDGPENGEGEVEPCDDSKGPPFGGDGL